MKKIKQSTKTLNSMVDYFFFSLNVALTCVVKILSWEGIYLAMFGIYQFSGVSQQSNLSNPQA